MMLRMLGMVGNDVRERWQSRCVRERTLRRGRDGIPVSVMDERGWMRARSCIERVRVVIA